MAESSEPDIRNLSEISSLLDNAISEKLEYLQVLKQNRGRRLVMRALNPLEEPAPNALLASDLLLLEGRINHYERCVKPFLPPYQVLLETATSLYAEELKNETVRTLDITYKQCKKLEETHQTLVNAKQQREAHYNGLREQVEAYGRKKTQALKDTQAELEQESKLLREKFSELRTNMVNILDEVSVPDGYLGFDTILRDLTAALVSGQDGSYIRVTSNMWAPCVEFLLKHNVVIQHPRDQTRIRLVDFSEGLVRKKSDGS